MSKVGKKLLSMSTVGFLLEVSIFFAHNPVREVFCRSEDTCVYRLTLFPFPLVFRVVDSL